MALVKIPQGCPFYAYMNLARVGPDHALTVAELAAVIRYSPRQVRRSMPAVLATGQILARRDGKGPIRYHRAPPLS